MNKDYISGVLEELGDRSGYAAINGFVEEAEFYSRVIRLIRELNQENEKVEVKKYRKKPVVVEAYQTQKEMIIHTLEGDMKASPGDYIITGVNGEQYPCKPDIFEKTYEPV